MLGIILALCLLADEIMVATLGTPLNRDQVIAYIGQNAPLHGVDPAAMLAVANHEGLNRAPINGVGQTWVLPNEGGFNFGPPSWYSLGAGGGVIGIAGSNAPTFAWTPAGLDYWIQQVSKAAGGLHGTAAIAGIVNNFERPRADLAAGEIQNASADYASFQRAIQNAVGTVLPTTGVTDTGGDTTDTGVTTGGETSTTANPTVGATANAGGVPNPTGLNLSFAGSIQHLIFQFLLVIIGIALLLGGVYLIGSKK